MSFKIGDIVKRKGENDSRTFLLLHQLGTIGIGAAWLIVDTTTCEVEARFVHRTLFRRVSHL